MIALTEFTEDENGNSGFIIEQLVIGLNDIPDFLLEGSFFVVDDGGHDLHEIPHALQHDDFK